MRESFNADENSAQTEFIPRPHGISLRESLVGSRGKLSKELTTVARMLNHFDLPIEQRRLLFFYHLWHETNSFSPIKQFIEIKEDPYEFLIEPVLRDDNLVRAYEDFYSRFEEKTRTKTRYQERMDEILPLRGLYRIAEISEMTGYSQDYIKSVFKRALKKGLIKPLDKKEVAKRYPQYEHHQRIREGVQRLRNSDEHRYSEQEIADILSIELGKVVTRQQVKRQISLLLRDGEIERRINQIK